jgi:hypothetical protein
MLGGMNNLMSRLMSHDPTPPGPDPFGPFKCDRLRLEAVKSRNEKDVRVARVIAASTAVAAVCSLLLAIFVRLWF